MAEDNKSQNPTGQGNPPQDQNKSQGGSSASWEDALGALVEPDPVSQVPALNIPIPPQAQPQSQVQPQAQRNDQNRPQGDQGAPFKRKRKRRRKKKNFSSFSGNIPMQPGSQGRPQFQQQSPPQPQGQFTPQPRPQHQVKPQVVEPVKEVPLKKEEPPKEEPKKEGPKKEEARPTWEEALHSMTGDKKGDEGSVLPSTWEDEPEESSPKETEEPEEKLWTKDDTSTDLAPQDNEVDLTEPKEETVEPEESEEVVPETEGELVGEEDILLDEDKEEGVTKKHLYIGIGCIVLFIIVLVIGFFVLKKFVFVEIQSDKVQGTSEEEIQQEEQVIDEEEVVVEEIDKNEKTEEEVGVAPLLHPFLAPGQSPAFVAVSRIGLSMTPEGRFIYYVDAVKRLKILYETNINQLLDQSYDRRASLNSYLSALKSIQTEAKTALDYVVKEQTELAANYEVVDAGKNTMEQEFFNELQQLNSIASDQALTEFTKLIRRHSSIRARHRALANVRGFYERALPKLDARIRDIEANIEALVKGIKVIDIMDSDLGLIITEK